jgi:hypothetical protein
MSNDTAWLTFECPDCHGLVEMPVPAAAPEHLQCPHCGYAIPRPSPKSSAKKILVLTMSVIALGAVGFALLLAWKQRAAPKEKVPPVIATPQTPPLSTNQFTISSLRLEKQGALRYVQGIASNTLPQQRFSVKIHLELLDTNELRVGTTSDYRPIVQSNEVWQFRALVVEPSAVSAAVIGIQEDQ